MLSSGVSLERLSKPTASSLSKSKSAHSLVSTASPPKSKPTPTRTGALTTAKKTTTTVKPGNNTTAAGSTPVKDSVKKGGDVLGNGNGAGAGLIATEEALYPETIPPDAETNEGESDHEHEHLGNGSLEVSYTSETTDEAGAHDLEEVAHFPIDQEPARSHSSESVDPASDLRVEDESPHKVTVDAAEDEEPKRRIKDDMAAIVGLLETTSFTSKHILQDPEAVVAISPRTPGSDKRIGEIPDEE